MLLVSVHLRLPCYDRLVFLFVVRSLVRIVSMKNLKSGCRNHLRNEILISVAELTSSGMSSIMIGSCSVVTGGDGTVS